MRQCEADREQKHQKQAAIHDALKLLPNQLKMTERRAFEWIEMFEGLAGFY